MMNFTDAQVSKQFDLDAKAFGREAAEFFELTLEGDVVCYYAVSYLPRLKKYEVVQYVPYVGNLIWTGTTLGDLQGRRTSIAQAKELMMATALGLVVIGTAMTTFKDAIGMTNTATNLNNGIYMTVVDTNPANPLRNIRVVAPGYDELDADGVLARKVRSRLHLYTPPAASTH
jgi:hypothetical protein